MLTHQIPSAMDHSSTPLAASDSGFKRSLGLFDGILLVSGVMIGSGIFIVSSEISRTVGGAGWVMLVWVLGGIMTISAALSYGELSGMFPHAGGQYVYLREAYNPLIAFLYGWSFYLVIETGTIAAVAVAFAKYTAFLFPALGEGRVLCVVWGHSVSMAQGVAMLQILLLTYINSRGIHHGKWVQRIFTLAKILALGLLIVFGAYVGLHSGLFSTNWAHAFQAFHYPSSQTVNGATPPAPIPNHGWELLALLGVAMVGSLFSSDAWNSVTFIAAEIRNPKRNVGLSLFFGTLLVTVIYLLCNLVYLSVLPMPSIAFAPADRVATAASAFIFGSYGAGVIALMIMISTFGCNNGLILSGARVYYTMAEDGVFFQRTARLNRQGVPAFGLWIQAAWACLLCLSGHYSDLLNYVIFVVLIFYVLTIAGIFRLRRRMPEAPRPYKAFGYPVLPGMYILLALGICTSLLIYRPLNAWPGLLLLLSGIPVYYLILRGKAAKS